MSKARSHVKLRTPKFYIVPYGKINQGLNNLSYKCDVKSGLCVRDYLQSSFYLENVVKFTNMTALDWSPGRTWPIIQFHQDIDQTNILSKFHKDSMENEASIVYPRFF